MVKSEEQLTQLRKEMVERQIVARGITDPRVIAAFLRVPRHLFVPSDLWSEAYVDSPVPIGWGQTISQPYMVALMVELLQPEPSNRVLEIGTGSGYQTAILAELAKEVISIERIEPLARSAQDTLKQLGYDQVEIVVGDGSKGLPERSPFDRIIVSACSPQIYQAWIDQLQAGGFLVLPLGKAGCSQRLIRGKKVAGELELENHGGCVFVPLIPD
ncbi:MAG: protein-L-isoaspartate(D-aspartate) O-methyltransferase [Candidatus Atribacteria bacterium]|nr:protein-L-isoaspartate(D-aspartate) O-methyltransferase [Candidatus Atribacteria bacterium]